MKIKHVLSLLTIIPLAACTSEKASIKIDVNPLENNIEIHSTLVKDYFKQENYDYKDMDASINAKKDQGDNLPIHFSWNVSELQEDQEVKYEVSFLDGDHLEGFYNIDKTEIDFINYKLNTKYTMHVEAKDGDSILGEADYEFTTPDGLLRTITIDGMTNFRDLGDGKHIKQGLIYRSTTLANNTSIDEDHPVSISEKGKEQLRYLGLVSHFDLRKDDEKAANEPVVIKKVISAPLYYGGQNILTYKNDEYNNPEMIKAIFTMLGDPNNYPCDIHCVRGTDRTGCIAFLIKGLMGFELEDLYRDFLFSNFYNIGSPVKLESIYYATNPNATTKYVNVILQAEGETLKDKVYNYLLSDKIGVSKDALDRIKSILNA